MDIPPEILGEIFSVTLPSQVLGIRGRDRLLSLGLVSKRWRDVTLQIPNLWCGIQVGMDDLGCFDEIVAWYGRGGDIPKTLVVVDDWKHEVCAGEDHCPMHSPALLKLLTEGPALGRLSFYGVSIQCFRQLAASLRMQLPSSTLASLQALEVTFRSSRWRTNDYRLAEAIQPFGPAINTLSISLPWQDECSDGRHDVAQLSFAIPPQMLNHFTHLTVDSDWNLEHLMDTLQHCASLERLEVDTRSTFTLADADLLISTVDWQSGVSAIQVPKLHTVRLSGQHPRLLLLRRLIAPSLHTLDLSFNLLELSRRLYAGSGWCGYSEEGEEDPWDTAADRLAADASLLAQPLLPFIQRSNDLSTLRSLRLAGRELPSEELLSTLVQLPSLSHLVLERVATNYTALWSSLEVPSLRILELRDMEAMSLTELKAFSKFMDIAVLARFMSPQLRDTDIDVQLDKLQSRPPLVYNPLFD